MFAFLVTGTYVGLQSQSDSCQSMWKQTMRIGGENIVYDDDNFKGDHGDGNGNGSGNADDESTNGFQDEHEQAKLVGIQRRAWI